MSSIGTARAAAVDALFAGTRILPVVTIEHLEDALLLAEALCRGGLKAIEVTLRTPVALEAISAIRKALPEMAVGAGTIRSAQDLEQAASAGALYAISPGISIPLLQAAANSRIPFIAGVASASDMLLAVEYGHRRLKFFPAEASGGVAALKCFAGPFADLSFCPTGGINRDSVGHYLALPNVFAVGGSWMVPAQALAERNWARVTELAADAAGIPVLKKQ